MKCKGFTLIEIVSSLLIFAAGGTMALSVFNYNAGNRVEIMERMEASDLASGLLCTQILSSQTDVKWKEDYDSIRDVTTGWTPFKDIPIQTLEPDAQAEDVRRNAQTLNGAANFLKYDLNALPPLSGYQWRYRLIPATEDTMQVKRAKILHCTYSDPVCQKVSMEDHYILQLELSWPREEKSDEDVLAAGETPKRKKVLLNSVALCPD